MTPADECRIDPAVVAALYAEHAIELRAFLRGVLRDSNLADDALQTTFSKAVELGHTARQGSLKAWLFRVALNEALVIRRRQAVRERAVERLGWQAPKPDESPDEKLCRREMVESVRAALGDLPQEQRQVVHLRIYEEKTFAAIARALKVPLGTVLSRMQLALRKLKAKLEKRP